MKKANIEQSATRLFNAYFRHVGNSNLDEFYTIIEEAYSLHERLKAFPGQRKGLHNLDEFQLLKTLRNYKVHAGDFLGEAYTYDPKTITLEFKIYHTKLLRLCLVRKEEVRRAINSEKLLPDTAQEQSKVEAIKSQLIPYGEYFDVEPVVFNFIAKLYELLLPLNLSISGEAYASMQHSYEYEVSSNISHYVTVAPIPFDNEVLMENLVPFSVINEDRDKFDDIATTGINYTDYKLDQNHGRPGLDILSEVDKAMAMDLIGSDPKFIELAISLPHHIGAAVILDDEMKDIDVKPFNIKQELDSLQQHAIEIDDDFLPTHDEALLVIVCVSGKESHITPNHIYKDELISFYRDMRQDRQDKIENQKQKLRIEGSSSTKDKHKKAKKKKGKRI